MYYHQYLCRIPQSTWEDVSKVRELDNQSYNNLITEGLRHIVEYKKQHLSQRRKTRETLSNMICK